MSIQSGLVTRLGRALAGAGVLVVIAAGPGNLVPHAAAAGVTLTITIPSMLQAGSGFIGSDDGQIGCLVTSGVKSGPCTHTYPGPTQVTLVATSKPASVVCLNGACGPDTIKDAISFSQDLNYTGFTFLLAQPVYVGKLGPGTGTITSSPAGISCGSTCQAYFLPGADVTLTAIAAPGSRFQSWDNESPCALVFGSVCTFAAADYSTIYAIFAVATPPPSTPAPPATPAPPSSTASASLAPSGGPRPSATPGSRQTTDPGGSPSASDAAPSPVVGPTDQNSVATPTASPVPGPIGTGGGSDALILAIALVVAGGLVAIGLFLGLRRRDPASSDGPQRPTP